MKISAGAADRFVAQPDTGIASVLLYGPDQGLVKERAEILGRTVVDDLSDPFNVVELEASALKDDPARLSDEANALSFGGGRRLVRLRGAGDALTKLIEAYVHEPSPDALLVVEADKLGLRSSLKKLFEAHNSTATVACYPAEGKDLLRTSEKMLGEYGVSIENGALALLGQIMGADRAMVRREIEKLALYVGEGKWATANDINACLISSGAVSVDQIALCAADGNAAEADSHYQIALKEGVSEIAILRAMQRHFQRLDWVVSKMAAGSSVGAAIGGLKPPVFFKVKARFEHQMHRWKAEQVHHALGILTEAETVCKQAGAPVELVCGRAIMALSRMG